MSTKTLYFRVHTHNLIKEITECGAQMGIFRVPMNEFRGLLVQVGERCAEINDPILNKLMCDLAIYGIADPEDPEYDADILKQVYRKAANFEKMRKNNVFVNKKS